MGNGVMICLTKFATEPNGIHEKITGVSPTAFDSKISREEGQEVDETVVEFV